MKTFPDDFDATDQAFVESLPIEEAAFVTGMVSVVTYMDTDGVERWVSHVSGDRTLSSVVGYLQMVQFRLLNDHFGQLTDDE